MPAWGSNWWNQTKTVKWVHQNKWICFIRLVFVAWKAWITHTKNKNSKSPSSFETTTLHYAYRTTTKRKFHWNTLSNASLKPIIIDFEKVRTPQNKTKLIKISLKTICTFFWTYTFLTIASFVGNYNKLHYTSP